MIESHKITLKDGTVHWHNAAGLLHNTNGPAILYPNGDLWWYLNGALHRTDGPAVEWADGDCEWWLNGKRHRTDGPAIEFAADRMWYFDGTHIKINPTVASFIESGLISLDQCVFGLVNQ